jgi:hypothetical protein
MMRGLLGVDVVKIECVVPNGWPTNFNLYVDGVALEYRAQITAVGTNTWSIKAYAGLPQLGQLAMHYLVLSIDALETNVVVGYETILPDHYEQELPSSGFSFAFSSQVVELLLGDVYGAIDHKPDQIPVRLAELPFRDVSGPYSKSLTLSAGHVASILYVTNSTPSASNVYHVPVDSTMSSLVVTMTGADSVHGSDIVGVVRPNGVVVTSSDTDVNLSTNILTQSLIYAIVTPQPGDWSINVLSTNEFALAVSGISSLDVMDLEFLELQGRTGHQGFFPTGGQPISGAPNWLHVSLSDGFGVVQYECRNAAGLGLGLFSLIPDATETNEFLGSVLLPSEGFMVYAIGTDQNSYGFQRVFPVFYHGQPIVIEAPSSTDVYAGGTKSVYFAVTNFGSADTFAFAASNTSGYSTTVNPSVCSLDSNASTVVTVQLQVPNTAKGDTSVTLTLTAQSTNYSTSANSASVLNLVHSPAALTISNGYNNAVISWVGIGTLQSAGAASGPWSDVGGAFPPYIAPVTTSNMFFRLKQD